MCLSKHMFRNDLRLPISLWHLQSHTDTGIKLALIYYCVVSCFLYWALPFHPCLAPVTGISVVGSWALRNGRWFTWGIRLKNPLNCVQWWNLLRKLVWKIALELLGRIEEYVFIPYIQGKPFEREKSFF